MKIRVAMSRKASHSLVQFRSENLIMKKLIAELTIATALTIGAIFASATGALANDITVIDAFARASATPNPMSGAAYISVKNNGGEADQLLRITAEGVGSIMLHETKMSDDMSSMMETDLPEIAANSTLTMAPGGLHLMLMGLEKPLKKGENLKLVLTFEKFGPLEVSVPIGSVGALQPDS
jgi:periplasmic copper chaperone A